MRNSTDNSAVGNPPILAIVDDEVDYRSIVRRVAEPIGWNVHEMASGSELRERLDGGLAPDLLILDMLMPGEDGIELATTLKSYPAIASVLIVTGGPLVFASAVQLQLEDSHIEVLAPLQKPVRTNDLRSVLTSTFAGLART